MFFTTQFWVIFHAFILGAILFDLLLSHRFENRPLFPVLLTTLWIVAGVGFAGVLYVYDTPQDAFIYLNGYLIEKSLSVDNVFVFYMVFRQLKLPLRFQHNVLFLGILGALVFRALFIWLGVSVIEKFSYLIPVMGIFLLIMAYKFWFAKEEESYEESWWQQKIKSWIRLHPSIQGPKFIIKENKRLFLTASGLALIYVETADLIFALDSLPAIMAFTLDPKIIYLSNVFAIMGLRALYFCIAQMSQRFSTLHYGISALLGFAGVKMVLKDFVHLPSLVSFAIILSIIGITVLVEWRLRLRKRNR